MEAGSTMNLTPEAGPQVKDAAERPFGAAAAAMIAAGIGALVLGVLTTLNEASTSVHDFLAFNDGVGPLAGKTIFGGAAFFVAWAVLHGLWRDKNPAVRTVIWATVILLALGVLGTFPIFFQAFAAE